jgi:DNA-binding beta-propeller fold protein YncE
MTGIRIATPLALLGALALLSGCSSSSGSAAIAPSVLAPIHPVSQMRTLPSFYRCPSHGGLKYVSDYNNNAIDIYAGNFNGQAPCGVLTSHVSAPWGMSVDAATHDLYVANDFGHDIIVFHRGQTMPYDTYTDPTGQDPVDVVLAADGTVIASNLVRENLLEDGSLSTWIAGPNGGSFVANFAMPTGGVGQFLAVRADGTVFFDKLEGQTDIGSLWSVSCPAGACGSMTEVIGATLAGPTGLAFDSGGDLRLDEAGSGLADTFELPRTRAKSFQVMGSPTGLAINDFEHHWFIADGLDNQAEEYLYPGGTLIGVVAGNSGGGTFGVAVDPDRLR